MHSASDDSGSSDDEVGSLEDFVVRDGDADALKKLPHKEATWYGKASKIYCKAQVVLAQDKRYGNKAAFDAVDKSRKAYNPGSYYGPDYERYGHGYGYGYW